MKLYFKIILIFISFQINGVAQLYVDYKHPTEKFEIAIPKGWTHSISKELALIAFSPSEITPRENFNINIIKTGNDDFDGSYDFFINIISSGKDSKILKQGEITINNRKYKWLIENHKNSINGIEMTNYIYLTNKNGDIFILNMIAATENFNASKSMFDTIAASLKY